MSSGFDGLERIQKELEEAQADARQQFFDSFRQYRQSFLPEPSLFPSDFSTRSPAYQRAWIECQIEAHERKIAEIGGSSKQPPDSLIAAGAALISGIGVSMLRARLIELKARLAEFVDPAPAPEPTSEERRRQKLAAAEAALKAAEDYAADLRSEASEVLKGISSSDPYFRKMQNEYNDKIRIAVESVSRAKEDLRRLKFTKA